MFAMCTLGAYDSLIPKISDVPDETSMKGEKKKQRKIHCLRI